VTEALFPGYLFINAQPQQGGLSYTTIRSSRGVSKIVSFGAEPITIPEALIEELKQREGSGLVNDKEKNLPLKGDRVNILEGPFKGLQAVYSHADGQQRAVVLINLLHPQTPTSLTNTQIQKIA
jgi:transcriptional antiterminator RfaH